jgi:transcriptional regulator with XRE-family HTH domain
MEQTQRRDPEVARVAGERAEAIGAYLARQRELRGITLEELSSATRIPLRSLQRLETGAFDREPDGFARGFVRTVAIALGLPPDETVARMLPEASGADERRGFGAGLGRRALAASLFLFALAIAALVWSGSRLLPTGWTRSRDEVVLRRDAVRALAKERGLLTPPPPPVAAPAEAKPADQKLPSLPTPPKRHARSAP